MGQGLYLFVASDPRCGRSAETGLCRGPGSAHPGQERGKLKKDLGTG